MELTNMSASKIITDSPLRLGEKKKIKIEKRKNERRIGSRERTKRKKQLNRQTRESSEQHSDHRNQIILFVANK